MKKIAVIAVLLIGLVWTIGVVRSQAQTKPDAEKGASLPAGISLSQSSGDSVKQVQEVEKNIEKLKKGPSTMEELRKIVINLATPIALPQLTRVAKDKKAGWELRYICLELLVGFYGTKKETSDRIIAEWASIIRDQSQQDYIRGQVAIYLGSLADPQGKETLIGALNDTSSYLRGRATQALVYFKDDSVVPLLIKVLEKENNRKALGYELDALGNFKRKDVCEVLLNYLNCQDEGICGTAIRGLGEQKNPELIKTIQPFINSKNDYIRLEATNALAEIGGDEALAILVGILLNSQDGLAVWDAADALAAMGDKRAIKPLQKAKQRGDMQGEVSQRRLNNALQKLEKK